MLSRSLGRIFEHTVHLSRVSAKLASFVRLPSWNGFVETADYALDTVGRFVDDMAELDGAEDGLLRRMIDDGVKGDVLRRIVVDLIVAAGDTVSSISK